MANNSTISSLSSLLEKELHRLVATTGFGSNLKVCHEPRGNFPIDGKVKDNVISIYCESKEEAILTLRHEFIDWLIVESVRPYEDLINLHRVAINAIFKNIQDRSYSKKEEAVEALVKLLCGRDGVD